jgi:hypothetical protein
MMNIEIDFSGISSTVTCNKNKYYGEYMTEAKSARSLMSFQKLAPLLIAAGLMLYALHACAVGPVFHSFSFGSYGENPGIEVLDYQYGTSKMPGVAANKERVAMGHIGQGGGTSGAMQVGDFLYVKWRINSTGKVYEDKVDLKSRLPSDMYLKIIHFAIKGPQLYVYLIEGDDSAHLHAKGAPDCPAVEYKDLKCTTLYPEHWTNF